MIFQNNWTAASVMRDYIQPAARKVGINKKMSWHTFRHYAGCRTIPGEIVFVPADGGLS
jgi:hypothetical protein